MNKKTNLSNNEKAVYFCIADNIKILRSAAKITQYELADKANVSRQHMSNIERKKYFPPLYLFLRLLTVLNDNKFEIDYFMTMFHENIYTSKYAFKLNKLYTHDENLKSEPAGFYVCH